MVGTEFRIKVTEDSDTNGFTHGSIVLEGGAGTGVTWLGGWCWLKGRTTDDQLSAVLFFPSPKRPSHRQHSERARLGDGFQHPNFGINLTGAQRLSGHSLIRVAKQSDVDMGFVLVYVGFHAEANPPVMGLVVDVKYDAEETVVNVGEWATDITRVRGDDPNRRVLLLPELACWSNAVPCRQSGWWVRGSPSVAQNGILRS